MLHSATSSSGSIGRGGGALPPPVAEQTFFNFFWAFLSPFSLAFILACFSNPKSWSLETDWSLSDWRLNAYKVSRILIKLQEIPTFSILYACTHNSTTCSKVTRDIQNISFDSFFFTFTKKTNLNQTYCSYSSELDPKTLVKKIAFHFGSLYPLDFIKQKNEYNLKEGESTLFLSKRM